MSALQPLLNQEFSPLSLVGQVIEGKEANKQEKLANTFERYHPGMIGGDALTSAYTGFTGVQYFAPSLQALSWVGWMTSCVGEVGGAINVWVAYQEFKEAYTAYRNGDMLNMWKMVLDAFFFGLIGILMIIVSLAVKVAALGAVGAFFAANPWILPVLFFVITIPLITEIGIRVLNIATHKDLAAQLDLAAFKQVIGDQENQDKWLQSSPLRSLLSEDASLQQVSDMMETFQADMGVDAALEVFRLFELLLQHQEEAQLLEQLEKAQQKIKEWHQAQYVRLVQQIFYVVAFILSMGALTPGASARIINGTTNMAMSIANLIPLGMDIFWPFKRNVPMVVPKVEA